MSKVSTSARSSRPGQGAALEIVDGAGAAVSFDLVVEDVVFSQLSNIVVV